MKLRSGISKFAMLLSQVSNYVFSHFLLYSLCSLFSMEGAAATVGYSESDHQSAQELGKLTIKILNLLII